jgi:glycerophosphoryl diester phosphodiesterase
MAVESHLAKIGGAPAMIYNIEVKSWPRKDGVFHPEPCSYAQLLNAAIEGSGLAARIRLQSFDYRIVRELWKLSPEWCYGLLVDDLAGIGASLKGLGFAPAFLNPHYTLVDESLVHSLHEQGLRVIPWTVNDIDDMLLMKHSGVDGIITDHPEVALNLPGLRDG